MHSVTIAVDENIPYGRRALPVGLSFGPMRGFPLEPSKYLCLWLETYTPSLKSIEMVDRQTIGEFRLRHPIVIGLKFFFDHASDAILFKLTWGGR